MLARPGSYWFGRTMILTPVGALPAYVPGSANPVSVRQPAKVATPSLYRHTGAVESPKNVLSLHAWPPRSPRAPTMPPDVKLYSVLPLTVAVPQLPTRSHPPAK